MQGIRHSDYGAEELKREYNRDLGNGLAISVALHLLLIFLFTATRDPNAKRDVDTRLRDLAWMVDTLSQPIHLEAFGNTEYKPGGGGGNMETKAPEGKSIKGLPQAEPEKADPKEKKKPKEDLIAIKNPPKVRVKDQPEKPTSGAAPKKDSAVKDPAVIGPKGDHQLGSGDRPAGGSGGPGVGTGSGGGVGYSLGGYGNRGWLVRPTARYPDRSQSTGVVSLRFTAQPNGDITNIVPIKQADQALVQAAIAGLRRARARPLPDGAEQKPQSYVITYNFDLR